MRFAGPDVVLFVVGLLLTSGSVYGLTRVEGGFGGGGSAFNAYHVEWTSSERPLASAEFGADPSVPFEFTLNGTGISAVTVVVDCAQGGNVPGYATAVAVTLTGPGNLTGTGSGDCNGQDATVTVKIADDPKASAVEASNPADAARTAEAAIGGAGIGAWSGTVDFTQSFTLPVAPPQNAPWSGTITATGKAWTATTTPVVK